MTERSPYSLDYPERSSDACIRYKNEVDRAYGPWTTLMSNRVAFRNKINRDEERVQFTRMTNEEIIELYGDERVKGVLKNEGLLGDEANIERVENDRPKVFSFKTESNVSAAETAQFVRQMNIF